MANVPGRFEDLHGLRRRSLRAPVRDELHRILLLLRHRGHTDHLRGHPVSRSRRRRGQHLHHRATLREGQGGELSQRRSPSGNDDQSSGPVDSLDSNQRVDCLSARLVDTDASRADLLLVRIHGCLH